MGENATFAELGGKLMKAGKRMFDCWMMRESDLVQASAKSFGERMVSDEFSKMIAQQGDEKMKSLLHKVYHLYLIDIVERDLAWYIANEVISPSEARKVKPACQESCRVLSPYTHHLIDSFKISDTMLSAPIALDWCGFNAYDNQGEVTSSPAN